MENNIPPKLPIFQIIPELENLTVEESKIVRTIIQQGFYEVWDYGCEAQGFSNPTQIQTLEKMAKIPLFFGEDE